MKSQSKSSALTSFKLLMVGLFLTSTSVMAEYSAVEREEIQDRVEIEVEKRSHQQQPSSDKTQKTLDKIPADEEKHNEKRDETSIAEPAQETKRKWWEFWK